MYPITKISDVLAPLATATIRSRIAEAKERGTHIAVFKGQAYVIDGDAVWMMGTGKTFTNGWTDTDFRMV